MTVYCGCWLCVVQVEVSASGRSFVQRSLTECGVSECDSEASIMRRPSTKRCCYDVGKNCELLRLGSVGVNE